MDGFEDRLRELVREMVREELRTIHVPVQSSETGASEYLSTSEAGRVARVSVPTIRRWMRERRLGKYGAGRQVRVSRIELEALMQRDNGGRSRPTPTPSRQLRQPSAEQVAEEIVRSMTGRSSRQSK